MTFFDKFINIKNRIKQESASIVSSSLKSHNECKQQESQEEFRVVVFRECDRRGRKLLFDSSTVERVPVSKCNMSVALPCTLRRSSDQTSDRSTSEFVEVYQDYSYKYKKPNSDVMMLGEMIFGTVAMSYKGGTTYKVHGVPASNKVIFSNIVHAPGRQCSSQHSSCSSVPSLPEPELASSSDSRLYTRTGSRQQDHTYPSLSRLLHSIDKDLPEASLYKSKNILCLGSLDSDVTDSGRSSSREINVPVLETQCSLGSSNCSSCGHHYASRRSSNNAADGSLSSLRKQWMQYYSSSSCDETDFKSRTKLGVALVLDLSKRNKHKLIFEHTVVIDNILCRLQGAVERAYLRRDRFVEIIYTAYQRTSSSLERLLKSEQQETPVWLSLTEAVPAAEACSELSHQFSIMENIYTHLHDSRSRPSAKFNFVHDFCEVIANYDTKNTNFFVSTLLTAVLTHHLSWVHSVASRRKETKVCRPQPQLCELHRDPRPAKTVVVGSESQKQVLTVIVRALTYFIRSHAVVEKEFDVDLDDVSRSEPDYDYYDSGVDCAFPFPNTIEDVEQSKHFTETVVRETRVAYDSLQRSCAPSAPPKLKRMTTQLTSGQSLYPDIAELAAMENVNLKDLDYAKDRTVFVETFLNHDRIKERVHKLMRVPDRARNLSPDEGYDSSKNVEDCGWRSVEFTLGDNQRVVKTVTTRPDVIELERECSKGDCVKCSKVPMPSRGRIEARRLTIAAVFGGVNLSFNPDQVVQGVMQARHRWEKQVRQELTLGSQCRGQAEPVYIIGDMDTWEVSLLSSNSTAMDRHDAGGVRVGMSRLVADTLESVSHMARLRLAPEVCLRHIEARLEDLYGRSKVLVELLRSPQLCTMDMLTAKLNVEVNDVVLLMAVAATHSPDVARKYGLSFL